MKFRKLISGITAFALAASAFAGLSISASAENTVSIPADATYINAGNNTTNYYGTGVLYANQASISGGIFSDMLSAYGGSDVTLIKFDASKYTGKIIKATLKLNAVCTVSGKNSNIRVASIGEDWEPSTITWDDQSGIENAVRIGDIGYSNSTEATYTFDLTDDVKADEDGIVGYGFYTETGRQQKLSNITLEVEYSDTVLQETNITINNVVGDNVIATYTETAEIGTAYEATAAQKGYKLVDGVYYIMAEDALTTIDSVEENAVLNIEFVADTADYLVYEDFSNISNTWGFTNGTSGSVSLDEGHLNLTQIGKTSGSNDYGYYYSDVKDLTSIVGDEKYLDVKFQWQSTVEVNKNRKNAFELYDSNNNRIFSLQSQAAKGSSDSMAAGVSYGIGVEGKEGTNISGSGWSSGNSGLYNIALTLAFNNGECTVSGTITGGNSGASEVIAPTTITASDLAKIVASDIYSLAPQELYQFSIARTPKRDIVFTVTDSSTKEPVSGAVITIDDNTATTDENGQATISLPDGTYTAELTCGLYAKATKEITVDGENADITVEMQYLGIQIPTTVELSGGSDSVYKPASGTNTTAELSAIVKDSAGYAIDGETVTYSIQNPLDGVTIDSVTGVISVTDATALTDDNGIDLVVRATSDTDSEVYAEKTVHVYNVARITDFDITGPAVVKDGLTAEFGVANVKDQYGAEMDAAEVVYSTNNAKAVFEDNVLSANLGISTEEAITVTAVMEDVTETKTVTVYGYDYYEPGRGEATYGEPRMAEVNGEMVVVFPGLYDNAYETTITLPEPVKLSAGSAKKISFKNTWLENTVYSAYRNLTFKNSAGENVLRVTFTGTSVVIDAVKENKVVSGTEIGQMGAAGVETEAVFVLKTDAEGNTVAALQYNGTSIEKELGANLEDIASYVMHDDAGCPAERIITLTDVKITDSDVAEVEVRGADEVAKIHGKIAKSQYTASIFSQSENETFTWTVSGADGVTIDENGVLSIPESVETDTVITVTYTSDLKPEKTNSKQVTVKDYASVSSFEFDGPIAVSVGDSAKYAVSNIVDSYNAVAELPVEYSIAEGADIAAIDENGNLTPIASAATASADAVKVVAEYNDDNTLKSITAMEKVTAGAVVDMSAGDNQKVFLWSSLDGEDAMVPVAVESGYKTGTVVVKATVGNPGLTSEKTITVTVGKFYEAGDVKADETAVDVSAMANYSADTKYLVTVLAADGTYTQDEVSSVDAKVTVDTTGASKYEVSPIYEKTNVGDARNGIDFALIEGRYDVTVKKSGTERGDLVINGFTAGNNIDQNGAARTKTGGEYTIKDALVKGGKATIAMGSYAGDGYMLESIKIKKAPSILERKQNVYVLGDSLVANYYGTYTSITDAQAGWGEVFDQFIKDDVNVTNLAESGNYAQGLYESVFKTVLEYAQSGDILIFECGYNDRNYPADLGSPTARYTNMKNYMGLVYEEATAKGIEVVFVTPNASTHGTGWKSSVQGTDDVIAKAEDLGASCINLSGISFAYLEPKGTEYCAANFNALGDALHSSYLGAMVFAGMVADGLTNLGGAFAEVVDTEASYTFTDTTGADITVPVE